MMCGFPLAHLDKHLRILVQKHRRSVALCEEFHKYCDPKSSGFLKPQFERRVVRILTPGTLIDESFLNPYANNFLLAISFSENMIGLAWMDVSTGEFFSEKSSLASLPDHLARIGPQEVVVDDEESISPTIKAMLVEANVSISTVTRPSGALSSVVTEVPQPNDGVFSKEESSAVSLLTSHLDRHLMEHAPKSFQLSREIGSSRMHIDAHTLKSLEIVHNIAEGGSKGSLMSTFRRTVTSSGTRLLQRWLCMLL